MTPSNRSVLGEVESLFGSCLCQSVKYEIKGELKAFYLCHCSRCRKVTGSAHASNVFIKLESLAWLTGEEDVALFHLSGTRFARAFCSKCSAALPRLEGQGFALIPAGSLDSDISMRPMAHISCASRARWDEGFAALPELAGLPG